MADAAVAVKTVNITISTDASAAPVDVKDVVISSVNQVCPLHASSEKCEICADNSIREAALSVLRGAFASTETTNASSLLAMSATIKAATIDLQGSQRVHNEGLIAGCDLEISRLDALYLASQTGSAMKIATLTSELDAYLEAETLAINQYHVEQMVKFSAQEASIKARLALFLRERDALHTKLQADLASIELNVNTYKAEQAVVSTTLSSSIQTEVSSRKEIMKLANISRKGAIADEIVSGAQITKKHCEDLEAAKNRLIVLKAHKIQMEAYFKSQNESVGKIECKCTSTLE